MHKETITLLAQEVFFQVLPPLGFVFLDRRSRMSRLFSRGKAQDSWKLKVESCFHAERRIFLDRMTEGTYFFFIPRASFFRQKDRMDRLFSRGKRGKRWKAQNLFGRKRHISTTSPLRGSYGEARNRVPAGRHTLLAHSWALRGSPFQGIGGELRPLRAFLTTSRLRVF